MVLKMMVFHSKNVSKNMKTQVCKNCDTRAVGCHCSCEKYHEYKQELRQIAERRIRENEINAVELLGKRKRGKAFSHGYSAWRNKK